MMTGTYNKIQSFITRPALVWHVMLVLTAVLSITFGLYGYFSISAAEQGGTSADSASPKHQVTIDTEALSHALTRFSAESRDVRK